MQEFFPRNYSNNPFWKTSADQNQVRTAFLRYMRQNYNNLFKHNDCFKLGKDTESVTDVYWNTNSPSSSLHHRSIRNRLKSAESIESTSPPWPLIATHPWPTRSSASASPPRPPTVEIINFTSCSNFQARLFIRSAVSFRYFRFCFLILFSENCAGIQKLHSFMHSWICWTVIPESTSTLFQQ